MTDFSQTALERDLEQRTERFVREVVMPYETDPRHTVHGPPPELVAELREKARGAGLLAPQLPKEWGGYGLSHVETATVLRASGYSLLGPVAMNCKIGRASCRERVWR